MKIIKHHHRQSNCIIIGLNNTFEIESRQFFLLMSEKALYQTRNMKPVSHMKKAEK